ncbi:MAG: hypothetical protein J3R72DRAFT_526114 [Linnemannia gamsii]|nr:MAG: hypothetical protein J3R72DRAFT_526114 [Linnemannia gamsii]
MISDLVDLSNCEIPPAKRRKLSGRARFSLGIVNRLIIPDQTQNSKQATLDSAVDDTIEYVKHGLRDGVRTILMGDQTGEAARLLSRMVLAYHLQDAKISFSSQQQSDFVDKALCRLRQHPDGVHLIMDEPIVVDAVEEELKASSKDPAFIEYLDELYQIVTNFGVASTSKGDALEPLVRRSLQRFNGLRLVDLPFLQGITLPKWCDDLKLQIDGINTANGFGYTDSGVAADLAFLTERPPNKMLIAKFGTRPDGAWFFSDKRYAGSLAIKFYSSSVPQQKHDENETSSDIRACFLQKDGNLNKNLASTRHAFVASDTPSSLRGILRIHLELPDVQNGMPATHVRTDPVTGVEDVMVYINLSNMDDFFFEGIAEHKGDMRDSLLHGLQQRLDGITTDHETNLCVQDHAKDFQKFYPDNIYISMVVAYPMIYAPKMPPTIDVPEKDARGVQQVVIRVSETNFGQINKSDHAVEANQQVVHTANGRSGEGLSHWFTNLHLHHIEFLETEMSQEPSLAPKPSETMSSFRKIVFLVAFVATVALIGLTDPAMGAPTSASVGSIDSGSIARLFKRQVYCEPNVDDESCKSFCIDEEGYSNGKCDSNNECACS